MAMAEHPTTTECETHRTDCKKEQQEAARFWLMIILPSLVVIGCAVAGFAWAGSQTNVKQTENIEKNTADIAELKEQMKENTKSIQDTIREEFADLKKDIQKVNP
jgi:flagellar basal body-associated protein FliL